MKDYLIKDPWKVIEEGFHSSNNRITESLMSIGNGYMGQRANFEECYSGDSMQGSYLAGIYYPDKTRVGWWKNGYPEYFAKVLNSVNWIAIDIFINGQRLDLATAEISDFRRELDMRHSILKKSLRIKLANGQSLEIESERFCSRVTKELGCIHYTLRSVDFNGRVEIDSRLDFDVYNEDANYDEQFWEHLEDGFADRSFFVRAATRKTGFEVFARAENYILFESHVDQSFYNADKKAGQKIRVEMAEGQELTLHKRVAILSSFYLKSHELEAASTRLLSQCAEQEYQGLRKAHCDAWQSLWEDSDIRIEGDTAAQQGIRFNIFHLHQSYSGEDARLNIGPKGFTGEKYGGSTYWDTEAYCLPFYLANSDESVARNLLMYRHKQLGKAIENAQKIGFKHGAALYPMVTMNGEECHNEWEITFEEIHRNGAIAYAIHNYTRYTGDESYLMDYGVDVLVGIARFWSQRVNWSEDKQAYVMLGVTGPNEYENNVNNNWYTNYIAVWCMKYTCDVLSALAEKDPGLYKEKRDSLSLHDNELEEWRKRMAHMYYPYDEQREIFLQQDGFLDKEIKAVSELSAEDRPLNQNWSWDRILRSCYIKQADVLQGIYFFEEEFDKESVKRHFDFYEPITVHESSLSPCVHAILACRIQYYEKAYEMYLRTARLDLDDYNNDTEDGLHITSMAGTWMSIVEGFAGMKVVGTAISFNPYLPENWQAFNFRIRFRGRHLEIDIRSDHARITLLDGDKMEVDVYGDKYGLKAGETIECRK